jgi:hypothetical protein
VPMNDDAPDHSLPLFLSIDGDEAAQGTSRIRIAGLVILAAVTMGGAVLAFGAPVARLAGVSSLFAGASPLDKDPAASPPQSNAVAQNESPAESDPTDRPTIATAEPATVDPTPEEPADQQQAEGKNKAASDALFVQFQAWAEKQNGGPEPQPDQGQQDQRLESPAQVTQDAPALPRQSAEAAQSGPARIKPAAAAPARDGQKRGAVRELQSARAEMQAARKTQAKLPHAHGAPTRAMEDVITQEAPAPTSQTPSLLQIFGWR